MTDSEYVSKRKYRINIEINKTEVMNCFCGLWRGSGLYDSLDEWYLQPLLKRIEKYDVNNGKKKMEWFLFESWGLWAVCAIAK